MEDIQNHSHEHALPEGQHMKEKSTNDGHRFRGRINLSFDRLKFIKIRMLSLLFFFLCQFWWRLLVEPPHVDSEYQWTTLYGGVCTCSTCTHKFLCSGLVPRLSCIGLVIIPPWVTPRTRRFACRPGRPHYASSSLPPVASYLGTFTSVGSKHTLQ